MYYYYNNKKFPFRKSDNDNNNNNINIITFWFKRDKEIRRKGLEGRKKKEEEGRVKRK